jgi:hypothetical protein
MNRRFALPLVAIAAATVFSVPAGASLRQIAVGNFYFEDETVGDGKVVAQVGDQLRFNVLDGGPGTPHTVEVNELGIHSGSLGSGETFTTPPISQAGTFILYCKPHDQRGHKTTLVVSGTSITTPTTAPTTTTTAPTTTTTAKGTTTTKPPATGATTTTTRLAGTGSSPTTTPTRATTTTAAPATSTTAPATTSPGGGTGATGSAVDLAGAESASTGGDATAQPAGGGGADGTESALAPVGRGTVGDLPESAAGSLDGFLNRLPRGENGPWTRSIRLGLAALLPMVLAAGVALRRWSPPPDPDEQ